MSSPTLPNQFLNKGFVEISATGCDEYMALKGMPWLVRKFVCRTLTKGYIKITTEEVEGVYKIELGLTKNRNSYTFRLNEAFEDIGYDMKKHKIIFTYENDKIIERHTHLEGDRVGSSDDIFYWYFDKDGKMTSECSFEKDGTTKTWIRKFQQE
ncbi:Calycin-like domain and Calycin domain-containing protein [Strongyloides ratti]|uniref:Calycin-like domain and Calycin domain-containing protein n=1 Tax=Strongyloides ratti TaxID=34506 RepID=A0A090LT04_STRRB|nr:Calycin-like domain and Calycin domain-containing protein [Strongyloides ratti]CEF71342.1 Calycin-like domain and Calycin domain-containing protein [Strongyloides ratti]